MVNKIIEKCLILALGFKTLVDINFFNSIKTEKGRLCFTYCYVPYT